MYKRSAPCSQPDLFSNFESHFTKRKRARLNDAKSWHNLFYAHLTSKIDEDVFSVLFDGGIGPPNAPIRQLFAMMIMKEGFGWSDAQLFDQCRFNILAMRALGLMNLSDEAPVESTYYLFKQALYAYQLQTGRDLVGETLSSLTRKQARAFVVLGQQIQMDSKLISSNLALCCRVQLVAGCLHRFWGSLDEAGKGRLPAKDRQVLDGMLKVKPHQVVYQLTRAEKGEKLQEFGVLLSRLQATYTGQDSDHYGVMARVFVDQYTLMSSSKSVLPKPPDEISPFSLHIESLPGALYRGTNT